MQRWTRGRQSGLVALRSSRPRFGVGVRNGLARADGAHGGFECDVQCFHCEAFFSVVLLLDRFPDACYLGHEGYCQSIISL